MYKLMKYKPLKNGGFPKAGGTLSKSTFTDLESAIKKCDEIVNRLSSDIFTCSINETYAVVDASDIKNFNSDIHIKYQSNVRIKR